MSRQSRFARLAARLRRSDDGAMAPLIGLMMVVLIGLMGFGIDVGRSVLVHARLVDALDAAGLAVGARLSTSDYNVDAKKFVAANFKSNYVQATVTDVTATPNSSKSVIALTATATMPTAFMKLFGTPLVTVRATSEVTRSSTGLELVMVLDNTGSMQQSNSVPALKSSAKDLLDILFGGKAVGDKLYVGLVPFAHAVNIGTSSTRKSWMNIPRGTFFYNGCVEERANGEDQTDTPPNATVSSTLFVPYASIWSYLYCPSEITPMTNVKSKIVSGIDAMVARGNTHINVGAVWGFRMLSPKWRGVWDGDMAAHSLPLDYGAKNMTKAAVIMTDGENVMNSSFPTAYGALSQERLGTDNSGAAAAELDRRLTTVCSRMKQQGVVVYTVAFDNPGASTKALLEGCATSKSYYFDAGDKAALKTAFRAIGDSLSNLRVSK